MLPPFSTQRSRELFAALAAQPNYPHSRATLAGMLWPEKSEDKARASLNTELWRVRQVLGEADTSLELTRDTIALNVSIEQVDIHRFRALVGYGDVQSLEKAIELYRGDFLEGCYSDWCLLEREHLRDLWQAALEGLLRHHESRGELKVAISFARRLNTLDPLREEIHRALMRMYAALGDRPAALAQYQDCKAILQRELGVRPMPETEKLFVSIRQTAPLEDHWSARQLATRTFTEHRLADMHAAKKYVAELYVPRASLNSQVENFIHSDAVGLILVGASGCGKTTFLAGLADARLARGDMVLLFDASALTLTVQRDITHQLWGSDTIAADEAIVALGREAQINRQLVWIIIDELNTFYDLGAHPVDLLRRLNMLIAAIHQHSDIDTVKFVVACREHPWHLLTLGGGANLSWQCYFEQRPHSFAPYTPEETRRAFDVYRRHYQISNSFDSLSEETQDRFSTPFFLRIAAETWQGQTIPFTGSDRRLFQEYFERMVANPSARRFIASLTNFIAHKRQAQILLSDLQTVPAFQDAIGDDPHSPLQQLLEAGILEIIGSEFAPRLRFTHGRLLEYLLAQFYEAQCADGNLNKDCLIDMVHGSWDFPTLWGAALTWLLLSKNAGDFISLAESNSAEARQLATEGLIALYQEDAALAGSIAKRMLVSDNIESKRAALFAASRMGETGFDLFKAASGSRNAATRQVVFVVVNAIYQRDPQITLAILHHILDDVGLSTFFTSPERIKVGLRMLGLFTRYGLSKQLLDEADDLIHKVAVKNLHLPAENNSRGRALVQRLLSINTTSWPSDRKAVEDIARAGSLSESEQAAYRRVLDCLKKQAGGLDQLLYEDLKTLFDLPIDAVRYLPHHQICQWLNLRQEQALPVIQSIFDDAIDPDIRLWLLMTFQPLNAPSIERFYPASLHFLENLTARFAEENPVLFFKGVSHGTLGLFGPIGFFPLGMRYARAEKFDFPLLAAYLAGNPEVSEQYLRVLAPVGWFYPREVLSVFEKQVNLTTTLPPLVIESLGLIWVSQPEVVDHFLHQAGASEVIQRQVHAAADIEQTLRAVNLIHNTDLRVSSVLLGAPYGRWVTDSVFQGYIESKNLDQAASRFGRGLVDIYMESDWRLKRILGLET